MVMQNKQKFDEENVKKVQDKRIKNQAIWEEQKKQIDEKNAHKGVDKVQDKEFFNKMGKYSSDVYYINEDKKKQREAGLKGNAGKMA